MGKEIWGISFVGMSIPRKLFFLYNFRKWNIIIKKEVSQILHLAVGGRWRLILKAIIFYIKIYILELKNTHVDLHECIFCETSKSVPGWPPGSAPSSLHLQDINFETRIKILTNLYLDINKGIMCETSKSVPGLPPGSASMYNILFLRQELKSWP